MIEVIVSSKRLETADIVVLDLIPAEDLQLPSYTAGAHIDIYLPGELIRQYSLCGTADDLSRYQVAILREPDSRGGSKVVHEGLREGDRLRISPPRNLFPLVAHARRSILLAGGIGVTPMLAMAEQLAGEGADFVLHYCARSEARMAFRDRLRKSSYARHVRFHTDDGPSEQRLDLACELARPSPDVHLYVCGPAGFIDHVLSVAVAQSWSADQLHREYFSAGGNVAAPAAEFHVQLASSGEVYKIPEGRSVVEVLTEHGVDIPVSCEAGMCGSCVTNVLSVDGSLQHNDMYLSAAQQAENKLFTPCCSRAVAGSLLVLDL